MSLALLSIVSQTKSFILTNILFYFILFSNFTPILELYKQGQTVT